MQDIEDKDSTLGDSCGKQFTQENSRKELEPMEDAGNVKPLVRTLLELFSEKQIAQIPQHGLEKLLGISEGMGCHLVEENNFISGAFTSVVACPCLLYKDTVLIPDKLCDISFSKEKAEEFGKDLLFKDHYLNSPIEFVSKHDTDCCANSHPWAMSSMLSCSGRYESVHELVEDDSEDWSVLPGCLRQSTLWLFYTILDTWEPQFHPLIREDDKEMLREIAYLLTSKNVQSFQPDSGDFLAHLQPYAQNYIEVKNASSGYDRAKEQTRLHEAFDTHLASGTLDDYVRQTSSSEDDFVRIILDDDILRSQFTDLDHDLLKLSHERRAKLLDEQDQLCLYYKHMKSAVVNLQLRDRLQNLICELEAEGFFRVDDDSIEWEKEHFSELVDKFNEHFVGGAFYRWMEDSDVIWRTTGDEMTVGETTAG
ncbi:hypothetical protein E2562_006756 [Oryza meyeriana var. granulata]|uniref:Uncharacterized protein n=1 Tax=Oryza meyeriana var. granulata TaxID=110450 RepID=A0A6G1C3J8_9ORYZ|nr:hypothetical protein E2562_006756 [Oryza meyeriana var. granulata]